MIILVLSVARSRRHCASGRYSVMIWTLGKEDSNTLICESITGRNDSSTLIWRVPFVGVSWPVLAGSLLQPLSNAQKTMPVNKPLPIPMINQSSFSGGRDKHGTLHKAGRDQKRYIGMYPRSRSAPPV